MKILVAEDDLTSRIVLVGVLRKLGHEVAETASGTEAWVALQQPGCPKLVILDWMMPGIDGVEVVAKLRQLPTERPPYVIMLTSRGEKADLVAGLDAGANDYLAKPFNAAELRARVAVGERMVALQDALAQKAEELRVAMEQIKTLRGVVPICAHCKKIRDDGGYWQQVEVYVRAHTEAQFSHGLCPACAREHYPEYCDD